MLLFRTLEVDRSRGVWSSSTIRRVGLASVDDSTVECRYIVENHCRFDKN